MVHALIKKDKIFHDQRMQREVTKEDELSSEEEKIFKYWKTMMNEVEEDLEQAYV